MFFSHELHVIAPDGKVVHARHCLPEGSYAAGDVSVLRKADGTAFFIVKPGGAPFPLAQYRLQLTYRRDNSTRVPAAPSGVRPGTATTRSSP